MRKSRRLVKVLRAEVLRDTRVEIGTAHVCQQDINVVRGQEQRVIDDSVREGESKRRGKKEGSAHLDNKNQLAEPRKLMKFPKRLKPFQVQFPLWDVRMRNSE